MGDVGVRVADCPGLLRLCYRDWGVILVGVGVRAALRAGAWPSQLRRVVGVRGLVIGGVVHAAAGAGVRERRHEGKRVRAALGQEGVPVFASGGNGGGRSVQHGREG